MKILKFWNGIPCAIIIVNFTWVQFVVAINIFVDLFSFFYQVTGHSLGEFQDSRSQNILKLECGTLLCCIPQARLVYRAHRLRVNINFGPDRRVRVISNLLLLYAFTAFRSFSRPTDANIWSVYP
jgi:hypothetical protein